MSDRYLKAVLTVIALELLWLGVKDSGTPVWAQARGAQPPAAAQPAAPAPTRVVITGVDMDASSRGLPVFSANPLTVEVASPVKIEADEPIAIVGSAPIRVEAEKPLPVETVPFVPAKKPGE